MLRLRYQDRELIGVVMDAGPGLAWNQIDVTEAMLNFLAGVQWKKGQPPPVDILEVIVEVLP